MAKITDTTSDNNMKQEKHSAGKEMLGSEEDNFDFESVSCFVLSKHSKPRKWTVQVLKWPWFERISMFVIFVNCVTLAMYKPKDKECGTTRCRVLENIEHFVFAFFCAEMVIKMIAMGIVGKKGYLQDKWNRLDFFIVIIGLIEKALSVSNYLTIIRAFRVLRPLRAINKVPSIRILVTLLLDTLPMLGNVLLLSFLIFFVFGIISVQLWQGKLRNRCFTEFPRNSTFFTRYNKSQFYKPSFDEPDFVCSLPGDSGTSKCSDISLYYERDKECHGSIENNSVRVNWNTYYNTCKPGGQNPFYNLTSFDNIGIAWIVIFQVITLEGWSDMMYFVQDSHSFWSWIYFVVLIVVGSFFLVNLCLVVITMQFQETKAREIELIENTKDQVKLSSSKPINAVTKFLKNLCICRTEDAEPRIHHHHHHHFYHHHHFHHHVYNCFVPPSPGIFPACASVDSAFFPSGDHMPQIQVNGEAMAPFSPNSERSEINQDLLAPPERASRRNSRTSICSHTLSIHSETSSAVSVEEIVAQTKSSVTLNIPSPTVNAGFFAFASNSSACKNRESSCTGSSEVSASATVSAEINPQSPGAVIRTSTARKKGTDSEMKTKGEHKPSTRLKDRDLLKCRRFSQPAHCIEMTRSVSRDNSSYSPSETFEHHLNFSDFSQNERNSEDSDIDEQLSYADISINDFPSKSLQDIDCQQEVKSSKRQKPPQIERDISIQSDDDMFDSLMTCSSASYDVTSSQGAWHALRALCRKVAVSKQFTFFIMIIILLNMTCMGLEHYNQPDSLTRALDTTNIVFVFFFGIEMVIKLLGYGVTMYLSNGQNVFDGIIVIVSACEIVLSRETSALSVFRSIRLLRIFKLVRPVRYQLLVIIKTMTSVMTFFGLLFLFIFAFAILGMNLFGGKFNFPDEEGKLVTSRSNFDSFLWAMVSVFQILTQENWNLVMYDGMRSTNKWASLYFTALMAIGYYVLFNLLVAILVEGFTNTGKRKRAPKTKEEIGRTIPDSGTKDDQKISNTCHCQPQYSCPGSCSHKELPDFCGHGLRNALGSTFQLKSNLTASLISTSTNHHQAAHIKHSKRISDKVSECPPNKSREAFLTMPELKSMRKASMSIIRKTERTQQNNDIKLSMFNYGFELNEDSKAIDTRSSATDNADTLHETTPNAMLETDADEVPSSIDFARSCSPGSCRDQCQGISESSKANAEINQVTTEKNTEEKMCHQRETSVCDSQTRKSQWAKFRYTRQYRSLFLFAPSNRFRCLLATVCGHKYFDYVVLSFILISCVMLALEEPNIPSNNKKRQVIDIAMVVLTVIFSLEMMMKIVAHGFLLGPGTYLKDGWNVLDGCLVLVSWIDVIITYSSTSAPEVLGTLKVFRALRTLRPLRMIRRAPGLKLVVQTLLYSLKPIGNTVLIAAIFFVMFGILGVQIFKGQFYYCEGNNNVKSKQECNYSSGRWQNRMYNFDNLPQALISLFVISTRDGWVKIMHNGIDAVGIDKQPIKNYAEWRLVYFIPFLMLGGFMVLNMIVGVVVENFQRCRERLEDEEKLRRRKKSLEKAKTKNQGDEERSYCERYSSWRRRIHDICLHPYWDVAIAVVIFLNVLCMSLEHYQMSKTFEVFVETANYFFTAVFVLEVILKFIAFGLVRYFKDRWNLVDLVIVVLSLSGIIIESLSSERNLLRINPTVARSLRVLRIIRVLKLVKLAKGVRSLLDTLFEALPQVANLGLLFLLLFFIYSCLGIQLFGTLECCPSKPCQGLGPHAHFRDFGSAMLTLFRIATGDNWNGILEDTLRPRCSAEAEREEDCSMNKYTAPLFFVTFVLAAQFVLVNVVIAVLMKHLKESKEKIAANMAAKDLERKLKLLTLSAKNFIKAKAKRSDQPVPRRQSVVQLGLGGIELAQLKHCEPQDTMDKSAFCTDLARADAIFQEFLRLNANLQEVKLTIVRTSSHTTDQVTQPTVTRYPRQRRNTISDMTELLKTSSDSNKFTVYKSGVKL